MKSKVNRLKCSLQAAQQVNFPLSSLGIYLMKHQSINQTVFALSPELITAALGHLCGNYVCFGPIFWMALSSLCILADTAHPLSAGLLWMEPNPILTNLFSTTVQTLMSYYDACDLVTECSEAWIAAFTPPDILWLFIHTADDVLLPHFHNAVVVHLDQCRGTQRGVVLQILANRLRRAKKYRTIRWRVLQRFNAEANNWSLPERRYNDLRRVKWEWILHAMPLRTVEKRKRDSEELDMDIEMDL